MQKEIKVVDNLATREAIRKAKLQSFPENFMYDAFLICTVREADDNDRKFINEYISALESKGKKIYYPARDTNQEDELGGYRICSDNLEGMMDSKEIHVYWTDKSQGTKFDLGIAFYQHKTRDKKIKIANRSQVEKMVEEQKQKGLKKSFEMVLLRLDDLAKE